MPSSIWNPFSAEVNASTAARLSGVLIPNPTDAAGSIVYVDASNAYFAFSLDSGAVVDGVNVLQTSLGGDSRWIRQNIASVTSGVLDASFSATANGTTASAAFTWFAEPGLGMYRIGTQQAALTTGDFCGLEFGNFTIVNLDNFGSHTPATVRYTTRPFITAIGSADETAAFYCRLNETVADGEVFQYGIYIEIPTIQNYTRGGSATKVIHRGHGDAHFVALLNGINAKTLVGATNASPIVCTVPTHGFGQGDIVQISGALGNTAANGVWYGITVIDANTFSLPASTGNGAYTPSSGSVQDIDPPVAYEGAQWGDGCTSFLASCQQTGGLANMTGFNFLYQQDLILNYAGFMGNEVPNNAFSVNKRTGLADSAIDGYSQYQITESLHRMVSGNGGGTSFKGGWSSTTSYVVGDTVISGTAEYRCTVNNTGIEPPNGGFWVNVSDTTNYGRQRWAVFNSGQQNMQGLKSTATALLNDSPELHLVGTYWDGAASVNREVIVKEVVTAAGVSEFRVYVGGGLVAVMHDNKNLSLQGGAVVDCINLQSNGTQFDIYANGANAATLTDHSSINDGETALLLVRNKVGVFSSQRVSLGIADSGGAGFKVLRVAN